MLLQDDIQFFNSLRNELNVVIDEFKHYLDSMNENQLNWRTSPANWSILQQLNHIELHNEEFLKISFKEIKSVNGDNTASPDRQPFRSTPMGSLYTGIISPDSAFKFRALKQFIPSDNQRSQKVQQDLLTSSSRIFNLIDFLDNQQLDLNNIAFLVPGSQQYKFGIGDVIKIMIVHTKRHLSQINAVLLISDF